LNGK